MTRTSRRVPRRFLIGASAGLIVLLVATSAGAAAWGNSFRNDQRLLPGTTIAAVDVGSMTVTEAIAAVQGQALTSRLEQPIEVTHGERRWTTSASELAAITDVEAVAAAALDRTLQASLPTLARMLLLRAHPDLALQVTIDASRGSLAGFVAAIAEEVDATPVDASLKWTGDRFVVTPSRNGWRVDRADATAAIGSAVTDGETTVELPATEIAPAVTTERAHQLADAATGRANAALDHTVTVTVDDRTWRITPRQLGAAPDVEVLLATPASQDVTEADIRLMIPDGALDSFVDRIAGDVRVAAVDADATWSDGQLHITPERAGRALDREEAYRLLDRALHGGSRAVALATAPVEPSLTVASFDRFLLLDQAERRLFLFRNGEAVRDWPVAVGLANSPTPRGVFTVGTKRHMPTWVNPSPTGWGRDMPARIGPGPSNPLGVRALNWNRQGRDSLIRFHGTPNEDSIGEAASRGCVRMYNRDVIELYDLVPSGTPIISVTRTGLVTEAADVAEDPPEEEPAVSDND